MTDLKDIFKPNTVTEPVQQPSDAKVTATTDKSEMANVIGQAESKQQAEVRGEAEASLPQDADSTEYYFTIERGKHKITITPEKGTVYNYHALCSCAWEGRFLTGAEAETIAKKHISRVP